MLHLPRVAVDTLSDAPDAPIVLLEREFPVYDFTWNASTPSYIGTIAFPNALFSQPMVADVLKWYTYFSADVELRVSTSGTKFSYGALILSWEPAAGYGDVSAYTGVVASSGYPHILISANDTTTPTMLIPWTCPQPALNVKFYPTGALGALDFGVLAPLRSADGLSTPSLRVTLYARFRNVKLSGPRQVAQAISAPDFIRA